MLKTVPKIIFAILALVVGQVTFLEIFKIAGVKPDICISAVAYFGLVGGVYVGLYTGAAAGLLYGLFSAAPLPIHIISFALCGYVAGILSKHIYRDNIIWCLVAGFLSAAFMLFFDYAAGGMLSDAVSIADFAYLTVLPIAVYTSIISPPLFFLLSRIYK
ncbi:MAG: rod shape-determining protein MreD [Candidatus Omnitrophica bacterium CG1_02_49_10]|nr:MAG: rod shape-determining protein MreD [Candidatus Omnitrophica bacterium CG1_02_49_10]